MPSEQNPGSSLYPASGASGGAEKMAAAATQVESKTSELAHVAAAKIDSVPDAAADGLASAAKCRRDRLFTGPSLLQQALGL